MQERAIVLFAHGSRDALWRRPIESVAARIRELAHDVPVQCAYLELMDPDLPNAVRDLVAAGARHITVVPMFLGVGRHAREDLPRLVVALEAEHSHVCFKVQQSIGEDPRVLDLMAEIALR